MESFMRVLVIWLSRDLFLSKLLVHDGVERQNRPKLVRLLYGPHRARIVRSGYRCASAEDRMTREKLHHARLVDYRAIILRIPLSAGGMCAKVKRPSFPQG